MWFTYKKRRSSACQIVFIYLLLATSPFVAWASRVLPSEIADCQLAADDALLALEPPVFRRLTDSEIIDDLFRGHPTEVRWRVVYFRRAMLLLYRQDHLSQAELSDAWLQILQVMGKHSGFIPNNYGFIAADYSRIFHNGKNGHVMVIRHDGKIYRGEDYRQSYLAPNWRPQLALYKLVNGTDLAERQRYWRVLAEDSNIPTPEFSVLEEMLGLPEALAYWHTPAWPTAREYLWQRREQILNGISDPNHELAIAERLNAILARYPLN